MPLKSFYCAINYIWLYSLFVRLIRSISKYITNYKIDYINCILIFVKKLNETYLSTKSFLININEAKQPKKI